MGNSSSSIRRSNAGRGDFPEDIRKARGSNRKEDDLANEFNDMVLHEVRPNYVNVPEWSQMLLDVEPNPDPLKVSQDNAGSGKASPDKTIADQNIRDGTTQEKITQDKAVHNNITRDKADKSESLEVKHSKNAQEKDRVRRNENEKKRKDKEELPGFKRNQLANGVIEDEYNELNDRVFDADMTEVSRNILANEDFSNDPLDFPDDVSIDLNDEDMPPADISNIDYKQLSRQPRPDSRIFRDEVGDEDKNAVQYNGTNDIPYKNNSFSRNFGMPVEIKWINTMKETINKVSIIGSFSNWRDTIRLHPSANNPDEYVVNVFLSLGLHKLLYIVNNEYRINDQLPMATDEEGIFFNWFEVRDDQQNLGDDGHIEVVGSSKVNFNEIQRKPNRTTPRADENEIALNHVEYADKSPELKVEGSNDLLADKPPAFVKEDWDAQSVSSSDKGKQYAGDLLSPETHPRHVYSSDIPEMFVNYEYFKSKGPYYELPEPPQLPAHLNNVLLNKLTSNSNQWSSYKPPAFTDLQGNQQILQHPRTLHNHSHHQTHHQTTLLLFNRMPSLSPPPLSPSPSSPPSSASQNSSKRPTLRRADSSYYASNQQAHLSVPTHVILNHLMTTSIKHDVLSVACITRYSGKFITQVMHSPADI